MRTNTKSTGTRAYRRGLLFLITLIAAGCIRGVSSPAPREGDTSIRFPPLDALAAVKVEAREQPHEIDGVLLKAIDIAFNDFAPPGDSEPRCEWRKESYRYRTLRQGDIIFVEIVEDESKCGRQYSALDSGAAYAISTDGRILRRLFGSQLGELLGVPSSGLGTSVPASEVGESQVHFDGPSPYLPLEWQDAGPRAPVPDGGSSAQDGVSSGGLPDGGR